MVKKVSSGRLPRQHFPGSPVGSRAEFLDILMREGFPPTKRAAHDLHVFTEPPRLTSPDPGSLAGGLEDFYPQLSVTSEEGGAHRYSCHGYSGFSSEQSAEGMALQPQATLDSGRPSTDEKVSGVTDRSLTSVKTWTIAEDPPASHLELPRGSSLVSLMRGQESLFGNAHRNGRHVVKGGSFMRKVSFQEYDGLQGSFSPPDPYRDGQGITLNGCLGEGLGEVSQASEAELDMLNANLHEGIKRLTSPGMCSISEGSGGEDVSAVQPFPTFFDPGRVVETFGPTSERELSPLESERQRPDRDYGILSPVGRRLQLWSTLVVSLTLLDLWSASIRLVFLQRSSEASQVLNYVSVGLTVVLALDVALRCQTGYIYRGRIVMQRRAVWQHYLQHGFAFDLIAAIPWGLINMGLNRCEEWAVAATMLSRTVKLLAMAVWCKGLHERHLASVLRHIRWALLLFVVSVHIHACIWTGFQPGRWRQSQEMRSAVKYYGEAVNWAYSSILGYIDDWEPDNSAIKQLEICLLMSERFVVYVMVFVWALLRGMIWMNAKLRVELETEATLQYLRMHKVGSETQYRVLSCLSEMARVRTRQHHVDSLLMQDLPNKLQQSVCQELWASRLGSLGLISHIGGWHPRFIHELSQLVREEVHGPATILFREGEASLAAYYILSGELAVLRNLCPHDIPGFKEGMWVGESALVSATLCRSIRLGTVQTTSLMVLAGSDFRDAISNLGLMEGFELFCAERLWRGFCGRCGSIGDHFTDCCPVAKQSRKPNAQDITTFDSGDFDGKPTLQRVQRVLSFRTKEQSGEAKADTTAVRSRTLRWFLQAQGLGRAAPMLAKLGATNLDELEQLDLGKVPRSEVEDYLSEEEVQRLSPDSVKQFRECTISKAKASMEKHFSHSHYFIFLSHYKLEAGTEAALMRNELAQLIAEDLGSPARRFGVPVFLDSENLFNLDDLMAEVRLSHNLVLLLTKGVLTRPWVLVELVTACRSGISVQLVHVQKPEQDGSKFLYPDDAFYEGLRRGRHLDAAGWELLKGADISATDVEECIRYTFNNIAVPYTPHNPEGLRQAQLKDLLKRCSWQSESPGPLMTSMDSSAATSSKHTSHTASIGYSPRTSATPARRGHRVRAEVVDRSNSGAHSPIAGFKSQHSFTWTSGCSV